MKKRHNGKRIEKIIACPPIEPIDGQTAGDVLLYFYQDCLGWNPKMHQLNPKKVRTTLGVYLNLYETIKSVDDINLTSLLNYGPGVDEGIPKNTVYLLEGWLQPLD